MNIDFNHPLFKDLKVEFYSACNGYTIGLDISDDGVDFLELLIPNRDDKLFKIATVVSAELINEDSVYFTLEDTNILKGRIYVWGKKDNCVLSNKFLNLLALGFNYDLAISVCKDD